MPLPKRTEPRFRSGNSYGNVVAPKRHLYGNSNHGWSSDEPAHEPSYVPEPPYVPEPSYVPEPFYVPEPSYGLAPAYVPAPAYRGGNNNLDN